MKRPKNVKWTNKTTLANSTTRARPYVEKQIAPEVKVLLDEYLKPGALFITTFDLGEMEYHSKVTPPPYVELVKYRSQWNPTYTKLKVPFAPLGTPVVYLGPVRTEETSREGTLRVIRHTFLVKHGRFIIADLNLIRPAELAVTEPTPDAL